MNSLTLRSPAKLNLFLKVVSQRPDGYHNLVTVFERIDLCDRLQFTPEPSGRIRIVCDSPDVPVGPKNLIYQAARLLQQKRKVKTGVTVNVTKNIPVAAGLAGGSSNAASTLMGLNRLWELDLSARQLMHDARALGSDVPFFLHDCSRAIGTGRGDRIRPLSARAGQMYVLVVPMIKLYSREVFTRLNLELTKKRQGVNIFIRSLINNKNLEASEHLISNDLESSILSLQPGLSKLKKRLESLGLRGVCFSGSGPAVFGLARSRREAMEAKDMLSRRYRRVYAVKTF